jgi:hypothetical protein
MTAASTARALASSRSASCTQVPDKATRDALRRLSAELDEQPVSEELAAEVDGQGGADGNGAAAG